MEKIIIVGGGGHAKVVIDAIRLMGCFEICGIVDPNLEKGKLIEGVSVIGGDRELASAYSAGVRNAFIAVGSIGDTAVRRCLDRNLQEIGFVYPSCVHPSACVAGSAKLSDGAFVAANAVVQPGSAIGRHAIINTRSVVDHDGSIGDFVHIAPGAVLSGYVFVGDDAHIGTGSCVIEKTRIGNGALIGAGSVVVSDIPEYKVAFGNPCRVQENEW